MRTKPERSHSHSIIDGSDFTEMANGHRHRIWPNCKKCAKIRQWLFDKTNMGFTEEADGHRHRILK